MSSWPRAKEPLQPFVYRLLMHVCRLLHDLFLLDQQSGTCRFRSILESETTKHRVFESFVRRFAARHCPRTKVLAMKINWDGDWTHDVNEYLPSMHTDVPLFVQIEERSSTANSTRKH
jgi:5-methylcytosine-specific restriction enzyme subunit McrC